ncbi:MAG: DNA adenine methylase [Salinarimonas sp.]|nr:DNA adenine methylase [Salinarimonas sp.]
MIKIPHPIPYQGSKRNLAPLIGSQIPRGIDTWYEPFAGSAAMTLWAAHNGIAKHYIIGDILAPISDLWVAIIERPQETAYRYREIWNGQSSSDDGYYNRVRDRYNCNKHPVDLLYLIARCVKNAIRFSKGGSFSQSRDKRRLGMHPDRMERAIVCASMLLRDKVEVRQGDWMKTIHDAESSDFIYMDPPYAGTTLGRDKRYAEGLPPERLLDGLRELLNRGIPFALSYDGMTGEKTYGPPLPDSLGLTRLLLQAGRSSQATLSGRSERTLESLYLSPGIGEANEGFMSSAQPIQERLAI